VTTPTDQLLACAKSDVYWSDDILIDPKWGERRRVHEWRNHVEGLVMDLWDGLSDDAKLVAFITAADAAHNEEWD
jgi:hypothetical protein